jgi:hypothetical protein
MSLRLAGVPLLNRLQIETLLLHAVHQLVAVTFIASDLVANA